MCQSHLNSTVSTEHQALLLLREQLPEFSYIILRLHYQERLSPPQIAQRLLIPVESVYERILDGFEIIMQHFPDLSEEE